MNDPSIETIDTNTVNRLILWLTGIAIVVPLWFLTYIHLTDFADFILSLTGYDRTTHMGEALHFFFFDTPKVLLLLAGIVFLMGIIQTFFAPERTRALLSGKKLGIGNTLAFMMSVIALSLPEMLILRKVLKLPLIATFVGVVSSGILLVGYLFNILL